MITVSITHEELSFYTENHTTNLAREIDKNEHPLTTLITKDDKIIAKKSKRKISMVDSKPISETDLSLENMKNWSDSKYFTIASIIKNTMIDLGIKEADVKLVFSFPDHLIKEPLRQFLIKSFVEDLDYSVSYNNEEYNFRIVEVDLVASGAAILSDRKCNGDMYLCHVLPTSFDVVKYKDGLPDRTCYYVTNLANGENENGSILNYLIESDSFDENKALHVLCGYYDSLSKDDEGICNEIAEKIVANLKTAITDLGYTGAEDILIYGSGAEFMQEFSSISQNKNVTLIDDCKLIARGAERVSEARSSYLLEKAACF